MDDLSNPKLRAVQADWVEYMGQSVLLLQDRQATGARAVVVPRILAPLLALCDGTRDLPALRAAFELRVGVRLDPAVIERALAQLDEALLLDNERFARAHQEALESYRSAPCRPATLAGAGYPGEAPELADLLNQYLSEVDGRSGGEATGSSCLRGLICPHIDYQRGGRVYAQVWGRAETAVAEADLFLILGTDHMGGPAELTLTRQSYQTPYGILPTDLEAVEVVAQAMGSDAAFRSELNHRDEHSIELAAVWLHHMLAGRPARILPVLCGSFRPFTQGEGRPDDHETWRAGAAALRTLAQRDRTLVIAAADLAHVGPSFGDPTPLDPSDRAALSASDSSMLKIVGGGDAEGFLDLSIREGDRYRVCGLPPIYLAMRLMGPVMGELVSYSQCPAPGGSVVSIAGILWSAL